MKNNQGFTLIELVVVIVILGILAATAAPKFIDLTGDATEATLKGVKGALNGVMPIVEISPNAMKAEEKLLGFMTLIITGGPQR